MINTNIINKFNESLLEHIQYVQEAGAKIGVPNKQLGIHDASKWSDIEFLAYAKQYYGGGAPNEYPEAWLHHIHHNPHHWQHWIFPDAWTMPESVIEHGALPMPEQFVLEMVADWMGASKAYTDSWDMQKWLDSHLSRIILHSTTRKFLSITLDRLGYILTGI